jgi:hypothetical protein
VQQRTALATHVGAAVLSVAGQLRLHRVSGFGRDDLLVLASDHPSLVRIWPRCSGLVSSPSGVAFENWSPAKANQRSPPSSATIVAAIP